MAQDGARRLRVVEGPVGEYLATLGWEHITLTGTYRWDLTATSTLENLLTDHPR
ncbi:MAG: hypothetical protein ACR2JR_07370 [Rubrobacteraceae bacterium]